MDSRVTTAPGTTSRSGTIVLDYGDDPVAEASVSVTGQVGILATSRVRAWFAGNTMSDNGAEEHLMAGALVRLTPNLPTPDDGFTIYADNLGGLATADSAVQPGDLAAVATSGDYADLGGTPTIPLVSDAAYGAGWNGNTDAPSKNAVYDKIETMGGGGGGGYTTGAAYLYLGSFSFSVGGVPLVMDGDAAVKFVDAQNGSFTSISAVGCPLLERAVFTNAATTAEFSSCPSLVELVLQGCGSLNSLTLDVPSLVTLNLGGTASLTSIDLSLEVALAFLGAAENGAAAVDISNNPLLLYVDFIDGNLVEAGVDDILVALDSFGLSGGYVDLSGGTNATPSVTGLAASAALILKGWTVTTN